MSVKKIMTLITLFIMVSGGTVAVFALTLKNTVESEPTAQRQDYPTELQPENRGPRFLNGNTNSTFRPGETPSGFSEIDEDFCARFNNQDMINVNRSLPANINVSGLRPSGIEQMPDKIREICADGVVTDEEKIELDNLRPQNGSRPSQPDVNLNINNN